MRAWTPALLLVMDERDAFGIARLKQPRALGVAAGTAGFAAGATRRSPALRSATMAGDACG
jgi:hypothetical protein